MGAPTLVFLRLSAEVYYFSTDLQPNKKKYEKGDYEKGDSFI